MSTITKYLDGKPAVKGVKTNQFVAQNTIDFTVLNVSAADVVQVLNIPKGALVTKVACYVHTAEGATCTATLGDGADPNGWDASVNLNSTGGYYSTSGTDAYAIGKFYAAADTIDLVMGHDTDAAKVEILAEYSIAETLEGRNTVN